MMKEIENRKDYLVLFNKAVELSLEWGEYWLQPINDRITKLYSDITHEQADELNKKCKEIQSFSWDLFEREFDGKISIDEAIQKIRNSYPELNANNISKLKNQGMYYARK